MEPGVLTQKHVTEMMQTGEMGKREDVTGQLEDE